MKIMRNLVLIPVAYVLMTNPVCNNYIIRLLLALTRGGVA